MASISFRLFQELKEYGKKKGIKKEQEGQTEFLSFSLYSNEPCFKDFTPDRKLELILFNNNSPIIESDSGTGIYPNIALLQKTYYEKPSHYYHEALQQYCSFHVKYNATWPVIELRENFALATGEAPTIANINRQLIRGLKTDTLPLPADVLQNLLTQEYKDTVSTEIAAAALLNIHGHTLDHLNKAVAASTILKAERALERLGVSLHSINEVISTFRQTDQTIAKLGDNANHYIARQAAEAAIEKFQTIDGREV